jgi:N-acetylmuramoyl-L-alanine amidase/methionine-rich copper-binding protein CopC
MALLTQAVFSQDFNGVKIYINPGHGGHDANDRHIIETEFWESEGNLTKGLFLRDILTSYNAQIQMSRTTNNTEDDKALSAISAEANAFNADYMHSIHSNAHNELSNYTLILYQGTDATPTYANAKVMGEILSVQIKNANRTTSTSNRGDMSFYGSSTPYLGVFKGLNMPGTLSEGSFHDYIIESWRLKNEEYLHNEAWAIARSFLDYYNLAPFSHGILAGLIRDKQKTTAYPVNSSLPNDKYTPLNRAKVTVQPGGYVYEGDGYNNGYFMFDSLAPGEYKVYYEVDNYAKDSSTVTVSANQVIFADKFLGYDTTKPATVASYLPSAENKTDYVKLSFSRTMNKASVEAALKIDPNVEGSFTWNDAEISVTFVPTKFNTEASTYTVTLTPDAKSYWNVPMQDTFKFQFTPNVPAATASIASGDTVNIVTPIKITFSENMQKALAEAAFSIQPAVPGALSWNGKTLTFTPAATYDVSTNYTVEVKTGAKSLWNIPLQSALSFTFRTDSRSKYSVVSTYPADGQTNTPYVPQIIVKFDAPILTTSTAGQIKLLDANLASVAVANAKIYSEAGVGYITFESKNKLTNGAYYTVQLLGGIKDENGIPMKDTVKIKFKIREDAYTELSLIDDFETIGLWKDPEFSGSTVGTDADATIFSISYDKKIGGSKSGKLNYTFVNEEGGVCRVYNETPYEIHADKQAGLWIYGDLSGNALEFWFYDGNKGNHVFYTDTLDWAGWDYKNIAQLGEGANLYKFHSVVVKQIKSAQKTGILYFDNMQTDSEIIGVADEDNSIPKVYSLKQNYPNPFNPSTIISFDLPKASFVTLKIFDILGREVSALINENMGAGRHSATFNGVNLPSGIYIYRLEAGEFVKSSKMMLVK